MKKIIIAAIVANSVFALLPTVASADDSVSQRICEYIAVDDKTRFRKFLQTNKLKVRNLFSSMKCNGSDMLIFAADSKALDTGELIIGQLPVSVVQEHLEAIKAKSAHLAVVAEARIKEKE